MDNQTLLKQKVTQHLSCIYQSLLSEADIEQYTQKILTLLSPVKCETSNPPSHLWHQSDIMLITYGDSIQKTGEHALHTLHQFLNQYIGDLTNSVHILPFFPYSSDDGFSVIDFYNVNPDLGNWNDIANIGKDYKLMADIVINHCSSKSLWFKNFKEDKHPGKDFFFAVDPVQFDISRAKQPRTNPILKQFSTIKGHQHLWCTFSHDQIDLNFKNPEVLLAFIRILIHYLDRGIRAFRLDAVGFLWKESGTTCLSLEPTHEIIRLFRTLIEYQSPKTLIITETNIPHKENLSYLGQGDEAHCIYNFALPPLLVNTLITGNCHYLKHWMQSMPSAIKGTTYFNFIASHDGIGLRPIENILNENERDLLINTLEEFGGEISWRAGSDGSHHPYEINISLYDALGGTTKGRDTHALARFICAHAIMITIEGIPGIYIHSLLGTENDYNKLHKTQHNRAINRHQWDYDLLKQHLDDNTDPHAQVFTQMKHLLTVRKAQSAFHPSAKQSTLDLGYDILGFYRHNLDTGQIIYCFYNIGLQTQLLPLSDFNLPNSPSWENLLSHPGEIASHDCLTLKPYQPVWLANHPHQDPDEKKGR